MPAQSRFLNHEGGNPIIHAWLKLQFNEEVVAVTRLHV
jgi:hypothetical protein